MYSQYQQASDSNETVRQNTAQPGLPAKYGDTLIKIMPRDPFCFYAYWEVSGPDIERMRKKLSNEKYETSKWVLRVYDLTGIDIEGNSANNYYDIPVSRDWDNYYVTVKTANRSYSAAIGIISREGIFMPFASSNVISMPRAGFSPITDENWAEFQKELERLFEVSGALNAVSSIANIKRVIMVHLKNASYPNPVAQGISSFRRWPSKDKRSS
ncbi:MAG: DUF4912 domain-containing protein [Elusimicrobia bacterium]|nr:DUF4912 domain-containing protein [Candidatus Liberimonas magnetica]